MAGIRFVLWDVLDMLTIERKMRESRRNLPWLEAGNGWLLEIQEGCTKLRLCPREEKGKEQYVED